MRGSKNAFGVIPWSSHGIQKTIKNTKIISIFNWIPAFAGIKTVCTTKPNFPRNDKYIS
ncbi:hypothetical protein [Rickettsia monacensis]|uniref:hypothetical protein n=1 Tax=Rickettsia monacensis TaxID=109232 RepID=UPI0012FE41AB|nr:hypothetical protein [Rickettsia monacensis]